MQIGQAGFRIHPVVSGAPEAVDGKSPQAPLVAFDGNLYDDDWRWHEW